MARVTKSILGEVRGKVGKEVRKIRNGKAYVASAPSKYTMCNEPHIVEQRNLFKVNGKFSSAVINIEILKKIWEREKAPATNAYNKISSVNYYLCSPERPTEENIISPAGYKLPVKNVKYYYDRIEFELNGINNSKDEEKFIYTFLNCCYEPKRKRNEYFILNKIIEEKDKPEAKLILFFDEKLKSQNNNYKKMIIYLAEVIVNKKEEIVSWSSTFSREFE